MAEDLDFHDELVRASSAEPFVPFALVTTSGAEYKIRNPEYIMCAGDTVTVFRKSGGSSVIRVFSIESIDFFDA